MKKLLPALLISYSLCAMDAPLCLRRGVSVPSAVDIPRDQITSLLPPVGMTPGVLHGFSDDIKHALRGDIRAITQSSSAAENCQKLVGLTKLLSHVVLYIRSNVKYEEAAPQMIRISSDMVDLRRQSQYVAAQLISSHSGVETSVLAQMVDQKIVDILRYKNVFEKMERRERRRESLVFPGYIPAGYYDEGLSSPEDSSASGSRDYFP
ncbi:hypothetical protein JW872_01045 [Candidatus Babeliales bacterium]|nr:hypothetical protein [Candidatus Babeliales bacterium]